MTAKEHYDTLLGDVYAWMLGDFQQKMREQKEFFVGHHISPNENRLAIDLGAGNGIQSVALAELGFEVKAVDFNAKLLEQLVANRNRLPIEVINQDISSYLDSANEEAQLVVCMGDTLTHLADHAEVGRVISKIAHILPNGGKAVFSWRDLSEIRYGVDRFIHVRSDDTRSMTCFLEYLPQNVMVHDIVTEKINGSWVQRVSCYQKLQLPAALFTKMLQDNELTVQLQEVTRGMISVICRKG